jgi:hypothetical protein
MWIRNRHPASLCVLLALALAGCYPGQAEYSEMPIPPDAQRIHVSGEWFGSGLHLDPATVNAGEVYIDVDDDLGIVVFVEAGDAPASPMAVVDPGCDDPERQRAENPQDGVLGYCGVNVHKVVLSEGSYEFFIAGEFVADPDSSQYVFVSRAEDERPRTPLEVLP